MDNYKNLTITIHNDHNETTKDFYVTMTFESESRTSLVSVPPLTVVEDLLTEMGLAHSQRTLALPNEMGRRQSAKKLGGLLFEALAGVSGFRNIYDQVIEGGKRLRLLFDIQVSGLENYPWELLYDAARSTHLALDRNFSIVRLVPEIRRNIQAHEIWSLHILFLASSPEQSPMLNYLAEKKVLQSVHDDAKLKGLNVKITSLENQATYDHLQNQMSNLSLLNPYHIVHFSGHGEFDVFNGGRLLLENKAGQKEWARASSFSNLLRGQTQAQMAFINACESGKYNAKDPQKGIASSLITAGVPIVIGMATDMKDLASLRFMQGFYSSLLSGLMLDDCIGNGRRVVEASDGVSLYWSVPILFLSGEYSFSFHLSASENDLPEKFADEPWKDKSEFGFAFVNRLRDGILNSPIVPWIASQSPSLDFIWPKLFIDPFVVPKKHPGISTNLTTWEQNEWRYGRNIAIIGPAGIGKTTSLTALFLEFSSKYLSGNVKFVPVFVRAAELTEENTVSFDALIRHVASSMGLKKSPQSYEFLLFLDGIDEVAVERILPILKTFMLGPLSNNSFILACRSAYFYDHISSDPILAKQFYEVLELPPWKPELSLKFAEEYLAEADRSELLGLLAKASNENSAIKSFLTRPFQLTLLLYLITTEDDLLPAEIDNIYGLYRTFYRSWIRKENARGSSWLPFKLIENAHKIIAESLYTNKGSSIPIEFLLNQTTEGNVEEAILQDSALISLLEIKRDIFLDSLVVVRFVHETLGEFHVAQGVLSAMIEGGPILNDVLGANVYNNEVNAFIRGAFELFPYEQKKIVLFNLTKLYIDLTDYPEEYKQRILEMFEKNELSFSSFPKISSPGDMENPAAARREQILYYLGRLPIDGAVSVFKFAFHLEEVSILRRIAAISGMLHGAFDIELEFMEKLIPGSHEDRENRSIQLVYFGDVEGELGFYVDDGMSRWDNTRRAICQRLEKNGPREMKLRWWDLRTLYLFCESRGWQEQLSINELQIIKHCHADSEYIPKEKSLLIRKEIKQIIQKALE